MFIVWSYVHNSVFIISIRCNNKSLNEMGLATFIEKQMYHFLCFQYIMTCLSYPTDKYLFKVNSRNTIFMCYLWSTSTIKSLELYHALFILNFEHILFFLLLTLNLYLPAGHRMKHAKQLKCTLHNNAVSLKHVHVI